MKALHENQKTHSGTDVLPDLSRLKQYTRAKQTVAGEVRNLSGFLKRSVGEREAEACRQLMAQLAEDRFALAVVGQFKRGKSSLMNAIIGRDLLPTGVLPLTSAITVLKYGPRERLTIVREGVPYPEEAPVSSLAEYVTEKGNPGNVKKVIQASLELPSQFLRRGLEFVDTPGIGSAIDANTATTYGFLPRSDAVIFVTSVDSPLTQAETDFLKSIRQYVRKIFFVVNKIDLTADGERQEVLDYISNTLRQETRADETRIFPVSSSAGLASRLAGHEEQYGASGVKSLQEALSDFLTNEKSTVLLVSVLDKALRMASEASHALRLLKAAGETSQEEAKKKITALKERFQDLRQDRENTLLDLRERLVPWVKERISSELGSFLNDETRILLDQLNDSLSHSSWKLSFLAAQDYLGQTLPQFKQNLEVWTRAQSERLNTELHTILHQEWAGIEQELPKIPAAAAEILGGFAAEVSADEMSSELPIHAILTRPALAHLDGSPRVPLLQASLPIFLVRSFLKKCLTVEIYSLLGACGQHVEAGLEDGVHEALGRMGSELEKRALEIESRIVQAVKGKRLLKGHNGHWQLQELDHSELTTEIETLAGIEQKLTSMRSEMFQTEPAPDMGASARPVFEAPNPGLTSAAEQERLEELAQQAVGDKKGSDLPRDQSTRGCPVCNRMADAASRFLASWHYALASQEDAQRAYADSQGFCPLHTWQLEAMASSHGLSVGYPRLMERLAADLSRLAASEHSVPSDAILALVPKPRHCQVCRLIRETEENYLNELAEFILSPEGHQLYAHSQGVCLRHLGMLVAMVPSRDATHFLIEHAARRFAEISEDMQNYALKRDALRGHTKNLDEDDAYLRGIIHSVGAKKVCLPWGLDPQV